jgi:hypothetical protein
MRRGAWLLSFASRLFHEDTVELVLEPAIADLQYEPPSVRGYAAVWTAFAGATCRDFAADVKSLSGDAGTLGGLVFMQACYYTCLLTLMSGLMTSGVSPVERVQRVPGNAVLAVALLIAGLSTLPTLWCFWPARRA